MIAGTCKYSFKTIGFGLRTIVNIRVIVKMLYATSPRCLQGILPRVRWGYYSSSHFFVFPVQVITHAGLFFSSSSSLFVCVMQPLSNQIASTSKFIQIAPFKYPMSISVDFSALTINYHFYCFYVKIVV